MKNGRKNILEKMMPLISKLEKAGKKYCLAARNREGVDIFLFNNSPRPFLPLATLIAQSEAERALCERKDRSGQYSVKNYLEEEVSCVIGGQILMESEGEKNNLAGAFGFYILDVDPEEADKIFSNFKPNGGV
jgi:hypothetical protein